MVDIDSDAKSLSPRNTSGAHQLCVLASGWEQSPETNAGPSVIFFHSLESTPDLGVVKGRSFPES